MNSTPTVENETTTAGLHESLSVPVAQLAPADRGAFLLKTYNHLYGAIAGFTALEIFYFKMGWALPIAKTMLSGGQLGWLAILFVFGAMGGWARKTAQSAQTMEAQYNALIAYVVAWSIMFVPLLVIADHVAPGSIGQAAEITFVAFAALTGIAFYSRHDFSFLNSFLMWAGACALMLIVASCLFGWYLGTWFSVAMIAFAGAAILNATSKIIYHYPQDRYVSASLELFASVALMLWYVVRLLMSQRR
jgi:FtsH-binding integral membrane protein